MSQPIVQPKKKSKKEYSKHVVIWAEVREIFRNIAEKHNLNLSDFLSILLLSAAQDTPLMFYSLIYYYGISEEKTNEIIGDLQAAVQSFIENATGEENNE